jgi:hypothetical protein
MQQMLAGNADMLEACKVVDPQLHSRLVAHEKLTAEEQLQELQELQEKLVSEGQVARQTVSSLPRVNDVHHTVR